MIIAGFSGVGKTTFCEMNKEKAVDFICMPYKYSNFYEVSEKLKGESIKAHDDLEFVWGWQKKYYEDLLKYERENPDSYSFIPTESIVLNWLYDDGVPYIMIYPEESLQEEYRNRYIERGDSKRFIQIFADGWNNWMKMLRGCPCNNRIVLKTGEYVSDVIKV